MQCRANSKSCARNQLLNRCRTPEDSSCRALVNPKDWSAASKESDCKLYIVPSYGMLAPCLQHMHQARPLPRTSDIGPTSRAAVPACQTSAEAKIDSDRPRGKRVSREKGTTFFTSALSQAFSKAVRRFAVAWTSRALFFPYAAYASNTSFSRQFLKCGCAAS